MVRVKEILTLVDCYAIVMEYVSGGELFEHVQKQQRLRESEAKSIMFQILLGNTKNDSLSNMSSGGLFAFKRYCTSGFEVRKYFA